MVALSLLGKDFREHRWAALILCAGCLVVVFILLAQNTAAAYSMSPFEIVRFALISFLPLVALIVGNRLIVREYLSGTRMFVEGLPLGPNLPLLLKYLLGFSYLTLVAAMMVALAAHRAGIADDVTVDYVLLIFGKTLVMVSLYWSIVFCFSLCGYLRVALYVTIGAIIAFIAYYPGIDPARFSPFALMDKDLFVYERDVIPWTDIAITLLLSLALTLFGFVLTRLGEGSVVERLAKPMTRRDYVTLGVLAAAGFAIWATLLEQDERDPIEFTSKHVLRLNDPNVSVLYLDLEYKQAAEQILQRTSQSLTALQAALGLSAVPTVRLALSTTRDKHDIDYATHDGVLITANWLDHDSYDDAILDSVIMHGVLSSKTVGRAMFEPYHWVLDGFTRWWVEQGVAPLQDMHRVELVSRALMVVERQKTPIDLIGEWQLLADRYAYPSAEAVAWAAFNYIETKHGRDAVFRLASEFLVEPVGNSAAGTFRDRRRSVEARIESVVDMTLEEFNVGWQQWVRQQGELPQVQTLLQKIPALAGDVEPQTNDNGAHSLVVTYKPLSTEDGLSINQIEGECILKHDYIGPFDTEFEVTDDFEDIRECQTKDIAHTIESTYAPGDRVFVALDFEGPDFHQPVRLHAERVHIP